MLYKPFYFLKKFYSKHKLPIFLSTLIPPATVAGASYFAPEYSWLDHISYPTRDHTGNFRIFSNKCNKFVYDKLKERGIDVPVIDVKKPTYTQIIQNLLYSPFSKPPHIRLPVAKEWNKGNIKGFSKVDYNDRKDGDVISYLTENNNYHVGLISRNGDYIYSANPYEGPRYTPLEDINMRNISVLRPMRNAK